MFLTHGRQRRARLAALAVADIDALHICRTSVDAAIDTATKQYGGPEGVAAELARRADRGPRQAAARIDWASGVLDQVGG